MDFAHIVTTRRLVALLAVVFIGVGGVLVAMGMAQSERADALDQRGVEVPAQVISAEHHSNPDNAGSTDVTVRFVVRGDERRRVETTLSVDGELDASRGDTIRVEYDADDPQTARLVGDTEDGLELIITGILLVLIGTSMVEWLLFPQIVRRIPLLRLTLPPEVRGDPPGS